MEFCFSTGCSANPVTHVNTSRSDALVSWDNSEDVDGSKYFGRVDFFEETLYVTSKKRRRGSHNERVECFYVVRTFDVLPVDVVKATPIFPSLGLETIPDNIPRENCQYGKFYAFRFSSRKGVENWARHRSVYTKELERRIYHTNTPPRGHECVIRGLRRCT